MSGVIPARSILRNLPAQLLLAAIATLTSACGTGHTPASPEAPNRTVPLLPPPAASAGLPALGDIAPASRRLSFTGPGYHSFNGADFQLAEGVVEAGTKCELQGSPPCSYAVYSLTGFAGDMRPTSVRINAEDFASEYWLAYADYRRGAWRFAGPFTSNQEFQLPTSSPSGLEDFISPSGTCSLAILTEEGQSVTINTLELGVDGGVIAPAAPLYADATGGLEGVLVSWFQLREAEADFAGFQIERSPQFTDDYQPLNSTLIGAGPYFDGTAADGEQYHYRVAAVDTSGNRSYSNVVTAMRGTDSIGPIPVLKMDPGPFEAPATVHFDLSESYVIGPGTIDTYSVGVMMGPQVTGGSSQIDIILQPGCYLAVAQVSMGAESRAIYTRFRVYPKWQDTDRVVIQGGGGTVPRLGAMQLARLPQGGDLCAFGYDFSLDSLVAYRQDGGEFIFDFQNSFGPIAGINEPVPMGEELALPVAHSTALLALLYDGEQLQIVNSFDNFGVNSLFSLASDGAETLYGVFPVSDGLQEDLVFVDVNSSVPPATIISDTGVLLDLDCVWNPAVGALDIVYADMDSIEWVRWDPVAKTVLENAPLDSFIAPARLDLEFEPSTGNLGLVYWFSNVWYYRYCDLATWTLPDPIVPALSCNFNFDFACTSSDRYFYGLHDAGIADLYRFDLATDAWVHENTPPVPAGATAVSICGSPTPGAVFAGTYVGLHGLVHELGPGGSAAELLDVEPVAGLGRCLKAAGGSDGLFVTSLDSSGKVYVTYSGDRGLNWLPCGPLPGFATAVDIGSQKDGEVYVSYDNPEGSGDYQIFKWDDIANLLVDLAMPQPGLPQHRPFISNSPTEDSISWVCYNDGTGQANVVYGAGGALGVTPLFPGQAPLWLGSMAGSENRTAFALLEGANIWEGYFASLRLTNGAVGGIVDPFLLTSPPTSLGTTPLVISHLLDSTKYLIMQTDNPLMPFNEQYACFLAFGAFSESLRYECDVNGFDGRVTDLPVVAVDENMFGGELRRTVSAAEAAGMTGVGLVSSLDGQNMLLQWSNFGQWEDLPLPPGSQKMSGGELLIGTDGRWYLLWHDLVTDSIYCRATL